MPTASSEPAASADGKQWVKVAEGGTKEHRRRAIEPAVHTRSTVPVPDFSSAIGVGMDGGKGSVKSRSMEKAKSNPLVPIGILATTGALIFGLKAFGQNDRALQQKMMRYRVGFQFATVIAIMGGLMYSSYSADKEQAKEAAAIASAKLAHSETS